MEEDAARCQIKGFVILRAPPTEEEGGGNPKKVAQCKRVKFRERRAGPTRQYNSRGVQWGANPAINMNNHPNIESKLTNNEAHIDLKLGSSINVFWMRFQLKQKCKRAPSKSKFGGQPFVLCPETSDEKVTTGKMGIGQ